MIGTLRYAWGNGERKLLIGGIFGIIALLLVLVAAVVQCTASLRDRDPHDFEWRLGTVRIIGESDPVEFEPLSDLTITYPYCNTSREDGTGLIFSAWVSGSGVVAVEGIPQGAAVTTVSLPRGCHEVTLDHLGPITAGQHRRLGTITAIFAEDVESAPVASELITVRDVTQLQ